MMNRRKSIGCVVRLAVFCVLAAVGVHAHAFADNDPASGLFQTPQSSARLVSAVQGTGENPVPASDAIAVMELLDAGLRSAELHAEVKIPQAG